MWNLERARNAGKTNCTLLSYPFMGHLVDLPFSPVCTSSSIFTGGERGPPGWSIFYGGTRTQYHALAQIAAWNETLQFFSRTMYSQI